MCEPTTIAAMTFALSAASTAASYVGQMQAAQATERANTENRNNALKAMELNWEQLDARTIQEREAAATEKANAARQVRGAKATAQVSAAESGTGGLSVDALLGDIQANYDRYASGVDTNVDYSLAQLQMEKRGARASGIDRINSAPRGQKPSLLGAGLQIGAAGLNYATDRSRIQRQGYA